MSSPAGARRPLAAGVAVLLDDPELTRRRPGEEFARAYAREGAAAAVRLRCSLSDLFPLAERRPRYTLRHLLRSATVDDDRDEVVVFEERAADADPGEALPEFGFHVGTSVVPLHTISAAVAVPPAVLDDPAALAAFVDLRLLVRLVEEPARLLACHRIPSPRVARPRPQRPGPGRAPRTDMPRL